MRNHKFKIGDVLITLALNKQFNMLLKIVGATPDSYKIEVLSNPARVPMKTTYDYYVIDISCNLATNAERLLYATK